MRLVKILIVISVIITLTNSVIAEEQSGVTYKPLILYAVDSFQATGACMILTNETDTVGKIADNNGIFIFENLKTGKYHRNISMIGHVIIQDTVILTNNSTFVSDTIYLVRNKSFYDKIEIPKIRFDERFLTIVFNFSGYILSVEDSLPIQGSVIKIYNTKLGAVPNTDGYFIVKNLKQGKYRFTVSSLDYKRISDTLTIDNTNVVDTFYLERRVKGITSPIKIR